MLSVDPLVYIIVLNYRSYSDTVECVRSLQQVDYPNFKVILVENGSDNESEQVLRETFPGLEIIQTGKNLGYSGGNNVGLRRALEDGAEFALILNPDTLVRPDFLSPLIAHARQTPAVGVLGSLILNSDETINRNCARRRPPLGEIFWNLGPGRRIGVHRGWRRASFYDEMELCGEPLEVEVVSGACMMLRMDLVKTIGLLDERTFLFWEEFILAEKVSRTGYTTALVPASRVVHGGGGSIRTIRIRAALHFMQSLGIYLRFYRGVGWPTRWLVLSGPALFFIPGIIKSIVGSRRP